MKTLFPTPQDCETAFYEALERADLDAMMAVWADEDEIYCIHPGGPRIVGQQAIRDVYRQLFAGGPRFSVQLAHQVHIHAMMLAVHTVHEFITIAGQGAVRNPIAATNIYQRTANGWRMMGHHASPVPELERPQTRTERPKVLH
jgi:ketosteroid isomerase-like protein